MAKEHNYNALVRWTGAGKSGTKSYKCYTRDYTISADGKAPIMGSSDPAFLGDPSRYNPEDMLVASVSACHMLWYLHLCAVAGIQVLSYVDDAEGTMVEGGDDGGHFTQITLHPQITISADSDAGKAAALHHDANKKCFIANSLKCPVAHKPTINQG